MSQQMVDAWVALKGPDKPISQDFIEGWKAAKRNHNANARKTQAKYKAAGLCVTCGEPAVNASHCAKHRDYYAKKSLERYRKAKTEKAAQQKPPSP